MNFKRDRCYRFHIYFARGSVRVRRMEYQE